MKSKSGLKLAIAVVTVLVLAAAFVIGWTSETRMNCWQVDLDLNSGRLRATRYSFWFSGEQRLEETALSTAIQTGSPEVITPLPPDWRPMTRLSPRTNPSHKYWANGTIMRISDLKDIWELAEFSPEAKRLIANQVLQIWKQKGWSGGTGMYLQQIQSLAEAASKRRLKIAEADVLKFHDFLSQRGKNPIEK